MAGNLFRCRLRKAFHLLDDLDNFPLVRELAGFDQDVVRDPNANLTHLVELVEQGLFIGVASRHLGNHDAVLAECQVVADFLDRFHGLGVNARVDRLVDRYLDRDIVAVLVLLDNLNEPGFGVIVLHSLEDQFTSERSCQL